MESQQREKREPRYTGALHAPGESSAERMRFQEGFHTLPAIGRDGAFWGLNIRAATTKVLARTAVIPRLRRIAIAAQGLHRTAPFGRGPAAVEKVIRQLGYVQIDTISVVERAHHHVLHSRVPGYQPPVLDRLLRKGQIFEYWAHAAAFLPIEDYRFARPRMERFRRGEERWQRSRDREMVRRVLARIRDEGPLMSRDFEDPRETRTGWWDWKPAKGALEQLFMEGELMVVARDGFQKTYDLTERVLPAGIDTSLPTTAEYAEHLVDRTLQSHGCAQLPTFTHLRRDSALRTAVLESLQRRVADQEVAELKTDDGHTWYVDARRWSERLPVPRQDTVRVLSPFDNSVIHRDRGQRLFDFDYTIECYVPEPRRRYGYFCLPLLYGDTFAGRVDAKAHRAERRLALRHLHLDIDPDDAFLEALVRGINELARFNGCEETTLERVTPSRHHQAIRLRLSRPTPN